MDSPLKVLYMIFIYLYQIIAMDKGWSPHGRCGPR